MAPLPEELRGPVAARLQKLEQDGFARRLWEHDASLWKSDPAHQQDHRGRTRLAQRAHRRARRARRLAPVLRRGARRRLHRRRAARHGRLEPGARGAAGHVRRRAWLPRPARAGLHRPGGRAGAQRDARPDDEPVHRGQQVGRHHRDGQLRGLLLRAPAGAVRRRGRPPLRGHHRRGHVAAAPGCRAGLPRGLRQPVRHRRPLLGAVVLRPRAGGPHGPRPRPPARSRRGHGGELRATGAGDGEPRPHARRGARRAGPGRPRQADAAGLAGDRLVRRLGRAAHRREHRQGGRPASCRSIASLRARSRPTATTAPSCTCACRRSPTSAQDQLARHLAAAGQPVITLELEEVGELGGEFFRWEVATAVAGARAGHRPLRPAQRAREQGQHQTPAGRNTRRRAGCRKRPPAPTARRRRWRSATPRCRRRCARFSARPRRATTWPCRPTCARARLSGPSCNARAASVRDRLRLATTLGYGPRYLHSTGQYHKGGPNRGVFLQLVGHDPVDAAIPGGRTRSACSSGPRRGATWRRCAVTAAACCACAWATTCPPERSGCRQALEAVL